MFGEVGINEEEERKLSEMTNVNMDRDTITFQIGHCITYKILGDALILCLPN